VKKEIFISWTKVRLKSYYLLILHLFLLVTFSSLYILKLQVLFKLVFIYKASHKKRQYITLKPAE